MQKEIIPFYDITDPYDIAYRNTASPYPVRPHTHNAAELYLTCTNLPDVLIDSKVSSVSAGTLIVIPPFCVHQLFHETDVVYERYILSIHGEWLSDLLFQTDSAFSYLMPGENPVILPLSNTSVDRITEAFQLALSYKCGESLSALRTLFLLLEEIDTQIKSTLPSVTQKERTTTASQQHVNRIIAYINEHLNENLSVTDLAKHFYLNPDYVSRLFKQHTHTSIGHYIALQRITTAQTLLRQGHSISEAQELLGYLSYAHFAKSFKKITGITPGYYIKSLK